MVCLQKVTIFAIITKRSDGFRSLHYPWNLPSVVKERPCHMPSIEKKEVQLEHLMPLIRQQLAAGHSVRFAPQGTSMLPLLRQGVDTVEFSPLPAKLKKYDLPLYQRDDGHYVLHRVVAVGETYTCIGDNQFVLETGVRHDQMLALATAIYRKDRQISANAWHYRLYCRFWHYSRPLRHFWQRGIGWLRRHLKKK